MDDDGTSSDGLKGLLFIVCSELQWGWRKIIVLYQAIVNKMNSITARRCSLTSLAALLVQRQVVLKNPLAAVNTKVN